MLFRSLHSDIDTLERIEIIRDLRQGQIDVLVGINLLREGLDIPECTLVAILDADKLTDSIKYALDETNRRRQKQFEYNLAHNITPQTIKKSISNTLLTMTETDDAKSSSTKLDTNYKDIDKEIKRLTKEMKEYAGDLEFEKAMICRDKIKELEKIRLTIE